jgi:hypothetical protein
MTVRELIAAIDSHRLCELYCEADEEFAAYPNQNACQKLIDATIDTMLALKPVPCSSVDTLLYEPDDGEEPYPGGRLRGNVYGEGDEERIIPPLMIMMSGTIIGTGEKQGYAMDFTPWNELMGLEIPDETIERYGRDVVALNIFYEMTWNGWTIEDHATRTDEILSGLPEEADTDKFIPIRGGVFWVQCGFGEDGEMVFDSSPIITHQYLSDLDHSSHEEVWRHLSTGDIAAASFVGDAAWNYYPRGRVEVKNGKATVYHHPELAGMDAFQKRVSNIFRLDNPKIKSVVFKADGSAHYTTGVGR